MLKNLTQLEHKIGDKIFHFVCDLDTQLPMVKDALFAFTKMVGAIEDNIKAQQEAQAKAKEEADKKAAEVTSKPIEAASNVIEPLVQEQQA